MKESQTWKLFMLQFEISRMLNPHSQILLAHEGLLFAGRTGFSLYLSICVLKEQHLFQINAKKIWDNWYRMHSKVESLFSSFHLHYKYIVF